MMQPPGRTRFAFESLLILGIEQRSGPQHLDRDAPAQRFLLRFVDDSHAAAADLAQQSIVPKLLGHSRRARNAARHRPRVLAVGTQVFHHENGGKQRANLFGQIRMPADVLAYARTLADAMALDKLLRKDFDRVAVVDRVVHARTPVTVFRSNL